MTLCYRSLTAAVTGMTRFRWRLLTAMATPTHTEVSQQLATRVVSMQQLFQQGITCVVLVCIIL